MYENASNSYWESPHITNLAPGQSSSGYTSFAKLGKGADSGLKKVCTVTCIAANTPTWNWAADGSSCTATFTCSANSSLTATVNADVTSIGEAAFLGCIFLKDITIPASFTSIGRIAFNSFSQDVTVTFVRPASQSILTIDHFAFNDDAALYYSGDSKYALFDESEEIELTGVPSVISQAV